MKRGTENLLKFKHIMRDLDLPEYAALGLLQSLWMKVDINCPRGDIGRFSNEDIALLLDWRGDPDLLVNTLVNRRWLDENTEHRLIIHDWPVHCEDTTHRKLARAHEYFADGTRPKTNRMGKEQAEIDAFYDRNRPEASSVRTACARRSHEDSNKRTACAPTVTVTDTDTLAVTDTDTDTDTDTRRIGTGGTAVSDLGSGTDARKYRQALWKRTRLAVIRCPGDPPDGRDPPEREAWWRDVSKAVVDAGGIQELEAAVKYIEDCGNSAIRRAKDLGELAKPAAYLTMKCRNFLQSKGERLPSTKSRVS